MEEDVDATLSAMKMLTIALLVELVALVGAVVLLVYATQDWWLPLLFPWRVLS